jgi:hypothetical protein
MHSRPVLFLGTEVIKNSFRLSVLALVAALLVTLSSTVISQSPIPDFAQAISTLPVDGMEYTNGTVIPENSPLLIWYDWISVSGTQVINYAIYTTPEYNYPVPIANLVGQHFRMEDGTQIFIASALSELEVYRDLNHDGIPQVDLTSGNSELLYFMYTNMSDGYSMTPVQKTTEDGETHYRWSFTYQNAHAYLQNAEARVGVVASLIFSHITLSYDFNVNGNVSRLKTNFDIGEVTSLIIHDSSQLSLDDLSLSLLYATATYTPKQYSTYVDGQAYNPATAEGSGVDAELAQIQVGDLKAYDFVFGGTYTLNRGESNETHQVVIGTYETKAEAVALSGIPITIRINPIKGMSFFKDQLDLADLFGGSWQDFNLDYESSSLIYRICFPVWDGMQIEHDPVYVGYMLSVIDNSHGSEFPTVPVLIASVIAAVSVVAGLLVYFKKRKR